MQEVEIMDVQPQGEAARELVGLDAQVPSPQAHPWAVKQSANEEMARDPGASATEDGHTLESLALGEPVADTSLIEKDVAAEEPMWKFPQPVRSQQQSTLSQCARGPWTPKKKIQVEVHTPKRISMTGDKFTVGVRTLGPLVAGRGWCRRLHPEDRAS